VRRSSVQNLTYVRTMYIRRKYDTLCLLASQGGALWTSSVLLPLGISYGVQIKCRYLYGTQIHVWAGYSTRSGTADCTVGYVNVSYLLYGE
jgi:hypothetical protein